MPTILKILHMIFNSEHVLPSLIPCFLPLRPSDLSPFLSLLCAYMNKHHAGTEAPASLRHYANLYMIVENYNNSNSASAIKRIPDKSWHKC